MADDKLDPNSAPSGLGTSKKMDSGVKKLNKLPLVIIGGVAFILILGLGFATMKRGEMQEGDKVKITSIDNDGEKFAGNMLNDLWQQSLRNQNKPTPKPTEEKSTVVVVAPIASQKDLGSPLADKNITAEIDKEALRLKKLKEKLYQTAINAPTLIKVGSGMGSGAGAINPLAMLGNSKNGASMLDLIAKLKTGTGGLNNMSKDEQSKNISFLKQKKSFDYLDSKKTKQLSPYEIKTGTLIPAVMISGINSDLPGPIKGQVRENVYDTATGEHLLIPQGTTLIGRYSADVGYGQERALIAWNRLIFPDGQTVNIGSMNGMDSAGYAGFEDEVDNHYFRVFGSAFLLTVLNGDITVSGNKLVIKSENTDTQRKETAIEKAASKMIEKQLGIAPTITIRPGYRFNIFVTKDMILEPLAYSYNTETNNKSLLPSYNNQTFTKGYNNDPVYTDGYIGMGKSMSAATTRVVAVPR
jgi:type IV secretion system protein VirB10